MNISLSLIVFILQVFSIEKALSTQLREWEDSFSFKVGSESIALNQVGFLINSLKLAAVLNISENEFELLDLQTRSTVYTGNLSVDKYWKEAETSVRIADFSSFKVSGEYCIRLSSGHFSSRFRIGNDIYHQVFLSSIKYYYLSRSGIELHREFAGEFERPASHPDNIVFRNWSINSDAFSQDSVISSPKGWFDAGDYNKYIVSSAVTVHTLLKAFAHHESYLEKLSLSIPESVNVLPDFVDEILWNLDWMFTMQDPNDGGVHHKLTTRKHASFQMPHTQNGKRYVMHKTTSATLGFAASFAYAARVLNRYDSVLPFSVYKYKQASEKAWEWAMKNPNVSYVQPDGFETGLYSQLNDSFDDEKLWAATELFLSTRKEKYRNKIILRINVWNETVLKTPDWADVECLALLSLAESNITPKYLKEKSFSLLQEKANSWLLEQSFSGFRVSMSNKWETNFRWGSNGVAVYKAMTLLRLNRLFYRIEYYQAALSLIDYIFGRNPTGYSFVTGFGSRPPMNIHHRVSISDNVTDPIPGMLVGGPHSGFQDKQQCEKLGIYYPSNVTALAYIDHFCSFATNEVAINWNAPLIYVLTSLDQIE